MGPLHLSVCNHSSNYQVNHTDNISGIRTRAIEIVNVFEMEFRWAKFILNPGREGFNRQKENCALQKRFKSSVFFCESEIIFFNFIS
jgi:hypothetical protein